MSLVVVYKYVVNHMYIPLPQKVRTTTSQFIFIISLYFIYIIFRVFCINTLFIFFDKLFSKFLLLRQTIPLTQKILQYYIN